MIIIEGTVRVDPAKIDAFRPIMETMIKASRAELGCIDYAYELDVLEPGLVRVSERWESRAALEAHFQTAHMAKWRAAWTDFGVGDRKLRLYEADPEAI